MNFVTAVVLHELSMALRCGGPSNQLREALLELLHEILYNYKDDENFQFASTHRWMVTECRKSFRAPISLQ